MRHGGRPVVGVETAWGVHFGGEIEGTLVLCGKSRKTIGLGSEAHDCEVRITK